VIPETIRKALEDERRAQDEKWGEQNHNSHYWLTIIGEEYGEACKAANECRPHALRVELVHTAASAIAAIECLDRNGHTSDI